MQKSIKKAVLKTLIYSDIFDYPLSKEEIWKFLIGQKINKKDFYQELKSSPSEVYFRKNLYCLYDRKYILKIKTQREKISRQKLKIAKKVARWLSYIPTTLFVGVSGALSLKNSHKDDDIDLFVIASKNTLWFTRLVMVILLILTGQYRKRNAKDVCDKICLNMLIDETSLQLPFKHRDLYGAHEVIQLMPIFVKNNIYHRFLKANKWVGKFLPNGFDAKTLEDRGAGENKNLFSIFEYFAKLVQLWYMKRHQTKEIIQEHFLAFHPFPYREKILNLYNQKIKKYGV